MVQDIIVQLKKINWFDELSDEIVIALAQKFGKRKLKKGEILFHKGAVDVEHVGIQSRSATIDLTRHPRS